MTTPTLGRMLLRGATKRCPRCGSGHIFETYFTLKERCPTCGYRFVREAGAFTGGLLMAWVFTLALMILPLLVYVFWRGISGRDDIAFLPFAIAAVACAVVVPIVGYPFSNSTWAAIDLASNPMEAEEIADAEAHKVT